MTLRVGYTDKVLKSSPRAFRGVHTSKSYAEAGGCSSRVARKCIHLELQGGSMELVERSK